MTSDTAVAETHGTISAILLRLLAAPDNAMLVRQMVDGAARELGASDEVIDDLKLAVTEGCSNVIKYAYRGEPGDLEVAFDPIEQGFRVTIRDRGSWLERTGDGEVAGGLGIPLMQAVTRRCDIQSDDAGTIVILEFGLEREQARSEDARG